MKALLLISAGTALLLVGCSKEPAEEYCLSQDQLAWQGYQAGKVIRFGNNGNASVRTYTIISVQDEMEEQYVSPGALPLPSKKLPLCQHLTVKVQRTDSVAPAVIALNLEVYLNPGYNTVKLRAEAGWDKLYSYVRFTR